LLLSLLPSRRTSLISSLFTDLDLR
jgi:hypothetical protein